jgi:hypothetical protein
MRRDGDWSSRATPVDKQKAESMLSMKAYETVLALAVPYLGGLGVWGERGET